MNGDAESSENGNTHSCSCQLHQIDEMSLPESSFRGSMKAFFHFVGKVRPYRVRRGLKRRFRKVRDGIFGQGRGMDSGGSSILSSEQRERLQSGDRVRIKTITEIKETLDSANRLNGCGFMDEMMPYCGTEHRVFKRVERFIDERDYKMKMCRGVVLLEGLICEGTRLNGRCDRSCYFFWREEWLEKIESDE